MLSEKNKKGTVESQTRGLYQQAEKATVKVRVK